jgi:hypothetical protein
MECVRMLGTPHRNGALSDKVSVTRSTRPD